MTNNLSKPQIRFKGFTEAWEQRKLGDIGKTFTGLSGKTSDDFGHGDAKFLPYLNIFNNPIADINFLESTEIDKSQNEIKYGDVFFTTSSETPEEVGMSSVWLGNSENIYLNSFCFGFRPLIDFNPYYFGYLLRSDTFRNHVTILAQGISRFNISKNKVMEIEIPLPEKQEQEKIGQLFYKLDSLITLHQRKLIFLKLHRFLMSVLFCYSWEQRKLGDISESYSGGTPTVGEKEYYDGNIPFIRSGEINSDKTELFLSENGLNNSSAKMVKIGDILYALYGATSGEVSISKLNGAINQAILAIQPHQNHNNYFLMQWLRKSKKMIIGTYLQGGQGNLSGNIVKELSIDLPFCDEQKLIGTFFNKLDSLITLHQRKQL